MQELRCSNHGGLFSVYLNANRVSFIMVLLSYLDPFSLIFMLMDAPIFLHVTKLLEEMKAHGIKLKGETYICLLNALAATGRTDQV